MHNYVSITPKRSQDNKDSGATSSGVLESKRRRVGVSIACNACRRKKIRCDGQRPVCSACESTQSDCVYRDDSAVSEESQSLLLEAIRLLNELPEDKVLDKLRSLKKEGDASAVLSSLRDKAGTLQPSDPSFEAATMSDAFQSLELGPQYPNAYPATPNLSLETLEEATYQQLVHTTRRGSGTESLQGITQHEAEPEAVPGPPLCDSRLAQLDISNWTSVIISNEYAARAISLYLETDHPLLGFFEPNLFVGSLTAGKTDYCSPMLVNALLYWACLNNAQDPDSGSLALRFCAEAESLWERQRSYDSILNLAAVQFLSLGYLGQGRDHVVLAYLNEASQMAVRMGLFGVGANHKQQQIELMPEPAKTAQLYAAWGSFNWITHMSLFYRQPGLQCPKIPPKLPIPWNPQPDTTGEPENSDNPQVEPDPPYMGGVFPYISWSNRLPPKLSRNDQSPHYVQILHIWLHAAILDLFSPHSTPENVCIASARQLKQLIINYRLNFASSSYSILWHTALTYLANAVLHQPKDENWFFYFLLCVYGYERLRPCWRVTRAISTALLSMALRKGDITSPTARQVLHDINGSNSNGNQLPGDVRATFMMDLDLAKSDPESATVEKMAQDFDQNLLLQQYTNIFDNKQ
ncbi:fungal zn(2)-Cys(6) binuclear cluster domain-containing protein [Trichoderma breve]|uniref:Fungal zn(2)-Cys(6) binuclear cluster domain-containing protein n=1 Tax=Trichoderma breve TaxID=2034170 RepID=A0A9W9BC67_9HYPO|nr:fungal zn(2)-Cys(6) binuclear cluster domain-containing protein [Trichoderma breve]KAJ4859769.1 fungal zn(2)-Cys(6) binuclear cluster domain-containing protein [Trichoderma breve]